MSHGVYSGHLVVGDRFLQVQETEVDVNMPRGMSSGNHHEFGQEKTCCGKGQQDGMRDDSLVEIEVAVIEEDMADLQQKLDALKGLVDVLNSMDEGESQNNATPPNNPHDPVPGRNRSRSHGKYNNTGNQKIKGLSNQTGFTQGNANGAINFGDLRA
ncbi:hypothetical protein VNO78_22788 [Psophocarpus tetragonolobus]|uniref:Uncharacterized protein n=1 Tax=Psophocarpus tetragonolobus TaxID=3891 RepID=A0AAN9XDV1_PSOTE